MAASVRHETRALLRAHLAAATTSYRHLTRNCPICHRLLRQELDSVPPAGAVADEVVEGESPAGA